jgi:phosphonate transport system substrate-binding protein
MRGPRPTVRTTAAIAALLLGVACGAPPPVADCPRGTLDARYCDRNGDLVADPPTDPDRFVDPPRLLFAYTPVEDPAVYRGVWRGFLDHLERETGRPVEMFEVQSYAAQIEALRAGRLHVGGFNTGSVPDAVDRAGFVPLAMMARDDGSFGYHMQVVVRADGGILAPAGLAGRTVAFVSPTSNSGYKAPRLLLERDHGLVEGRDYAGSFSGKHDNSVLGVVHGDYDAAAVASTVLAQMAARGVVDPADLRTVLRSDDFPTTAYGVTHDLHPDLTAAIRDAFFSFPWAGSALLREFGGSEGSSFVAVDYARHWKDVREIAATVGD